MKRTTTTTQHADWNEIGVLLLTAVVCFATAGMLVLTYYQGPWTWRNPLNAIVPCISALGVVVLYEAWKNRTKVIHVTEHYCPPVGMFQFVEVFGHIEGPYFGYRCLLDDGESIKPVEPTAKAEPGEKLFVTVYEWQDKANRWIVKADYDTVFAARAAAIELAGTDNQLL